jgi:hypothetical protein
VEGWPLARRRDEWDRHEAGEHRAKHGDHERIEVVVAMRVATGVAPHTTMTSTPTTTGAPTR